MVSVGRTYCQTVTKILNLELNFCRVLVPEEIVNFTNILRYGFPPIFLHQKSIKPTLCTQNLHVQLLYDRVAFKMSVKFAKCQFHKHSKSSFYADILALQTCTNVICN